MGSELGSEYYDKVFSKDDRYKCHYTKSSFFGVWKQLVSYIPEDSSIVDLGCGPGQFAELVYDNGFTDYYGIDFSKIAIETAKEKDFNDFGFGNFGFKQADLRTCEIPEADVYIACEVLEHITDDLGLLGRLPKGKLIIGSVPTYDSEGHVRYFGDWKDIKKRYGLIDFEIIGMFSNLIYFFEGELR